MDGFLFALTLFAALGCGVVAGVFFAFSAFVMRALARLPAQQGIAAMQSINVTAVTAPLMLVAGILPHALPELFALFLPLAAWMIASRRDAWHELLAATVVTVAIAIPILLAAAAIEVWVSPHILVSLGN
jgi:uncharacterized membrane protein